MTGLSVSSTYAILIIFKKSDCIKQNCKKCVRFGSFVFEVKYTAANM